MDDRAALEGILWVLRNDVPWRELPITLFRVSGVPCWRRQRDWHAAGVWQRMHEDLLAECNAAGLLDLQRALVDSSHVHALKGGPDRSEPQDLPMLAMAIRETLASQLIAPSAAFGEAH